MPCSLAPLQSPDSDSFPHKSKDSLSSGVHLAVASEDTMSASPEMELALGLCSGLRFPSLPENLQAPPGLADIQRRVSDPMLPGS